MDRAVDKAFALALRPTVLGAAYLLALTWHASSDYDARRKDLGDQADQIASFVQGKFGGEISRVTVAVIAAAIVIGAAHGLVAAALLALRDLVGGVKRRATLERAAIVLGLVAALHAIVELWGLAATPQLYAEAWYARGRAPRTIQIIASDVLHPGGVIGDRRRTRCAVRFRLAPILEGAPIASASGRRIRAEKTDRRLRRSRVPPCSSRSCPTSARHAP